MIDDRSMFPKVFSHGEISPELKVYSQLECHRGGATPEELAEDLLWNGLARGEVSAVTNRVRQLLDGFNRPGNHRRIERTPDGRYRQSRVF